MTTIWSILLAILIFGCIIAIHEFGHFIAAKQNGIQVNEFAIGMGPKIFCFQKGETLYSLRLFPIGGFCSMEGEDAESKNARAFDQKPVWRRMIVVLAGAFMNLVLGFVLLIATTCSDPYLISNTIHGFHEQATSNTCGLQAGDTIVSLNGSHIFTITDLQYKLSNESGEPFTVVVERDGKKVKLQDVRSKMNTFMYQVRPNLQWVKCGDYEQIGDIYYIDNGQDYLDEYGMIDLDLIEDNEELFL